MSETEQSAEKPASSAAETSAKKSAHQGEHKFKGKHRPARHGAGALTYILLLMVLGLAGGAGYLWQLMVGLSADLSRSQQEIQDMGRTAQSTLTALDDYRNRDQERADKLEAGLENLHEQLGRTAVQWSIAEAEYLIAIANDRLNLERDVATAITALQAADGRLHKAGDPELYAVRTLLAKEIQSLQAVAVPDVQGLALQLSALSQSVEQLPLKHLPQLTTPTNAPTPSEDSAGGWREVLSRIWHQLKSLVVIRRHEGNDDMPILLPDQRYYLYQNLRLKLESARWALLRADSDMYRANLKDVADWLGRYFDDQTPSVQAALQQLRDQQAIDIAPKLPVVSNSLHKLREISQRLHVAPPAQGSAKKS